MKDVPKKFESRRFGTKRLLQDKIVQSLNSSIFKSSRPITLIKQPLLQRRTFVFQQPFFAPQAAGVSGEGAVSANYAVARN